jgi:hypothetical protein
MIFNYHKFLDLFDIDYIIFNNNYITLHTSKSWTGYTINTLFTDLSNIKKFIDSSHPIKYTSHIKLSTKLNWLYFDIIRLSKKRYCIYGKTRFNTKKKVVHDINNLIQNSIVNLELSLLEDDVPDIVKHNISSCLNTTKKLIQLIKKI